MMMAFTDDNDMPGAILNMWETVEVGQIKGGEVVDC